MELTVIEMGKDIVVTAVDHELDAYCVFSKLSANRDHDAFIVITKWFVSRQNQIPRLVHSYYNPAA